MTAVVFLRASDVRPGFAGLHLDGTKENLTTEWNGGTVTSRTRPSMQKRVQSERKFEST